MAFGSDYKMKVVIDGDATGVNRAVSSLYGDINKLGGGFTAAFGGAIPVVGAAAAAIAAVGTAAVGVSVALFNITKTAAEFGSEIYDASQKTGLGAEALSSLKAAAETSGSSLEAATKGIAKFAKNYEGTSTDLQAELGKVMQRINAAKPGFEQLKIAQDAFGKSGGDLIPVIRSFDGDLSGLIKHMSELGVTIDDEAAAAADAFGDQMDILKMQIAGVGRTIGTELMPEFTAMATATSQFIIDHKSDIKNLAVTTGDITRGLVSYWNDATTAIANFLAQSRAFGQSPFGGGSAGVSAAVGPAAWAIDALISRGKAERQTKEQMDANVVRMMGEPGTYMSTGRPGGYGDTDASKSGGKGKSAKKSPLPAFGSMKSLVISSGNPQWDAWFSQMGAKFGVDPNVLLLQALGESSFNKGAVSPKGAKGFSQFMPGTAARFGVDTSSVKDSIRGQAQYMGVLLSMFGGDYEKALAGYNAGEGKVQKYGGIPPYKETREYVAKIKGRYGARVRSKDAGAFGTYDYDRDEAAEKKLQEDALKAFELAADRRVEIGQTMTESLIELAEYEFQKSLEYNDPTFAIAAAKQIHDLKLELIDDEILALEEKAERTKADSEEEAELVHKINLKKIERGTIERRAYDEWQQRGKDIEERQIELLRERDRLEEEIFERRLKNQNQRPWTGAVSWELMSEDDAAAIGELSGVDLLDQSGQWLEDLPLEMLDQFAQGVGSVVENLVLMGDAGDKAFQKLTASILANVAAQAAVLSIKHLAFGFAALTPWGAAEYGPAPMQFKAAALFGSIAVGAGLAGRAVAGDSFKQGQGSGASAGAGGGYNGYGGPGSSSAPPSPITRTNDDAFMSGRRSHEMAIAAAIDKLNAKIDSMSPGDVLTVGAKERRGFIGRQTAADVRGDYASARSILKSGGVT